MSMAYFTPLSLNASVGHFPLDMIPLDISAARTISLSSPAFPNSVKAKFWKLALTDTSDPNWPSPLGPDHNHNLSPNRPTGRRLFWKLALTRILDPNRSTAINFDDGRGNGLHPLKAKGELSGRGECPREYVQGKMSGSPKHSGSFRFFNSSSSVYWKRMSDARAYIVTSQWNTQEL